MSDDSPMAVVGYDLDGEPILAGDLMGGDVMGVGARGRGGRHRMARIPPRPAWRNQLAPGVIQPDEGLVPLPLQANAGTPPGTFAAAVPLITFAGQLQKPFRGERILVSVVRTGASAVGRLLVQLFVGTDLQGAEITSWDIELVGQPGSFGTRLTIKQAEPGVQIRVLGQLSTALAGTDTIFASMQILGRIVH